MLWYRRWTDRTNSLQLYKVGFWGTAVFDALCDIAAERDFGGLVPKEYAEPSFLMRQMNLRPGDSRNEKGEENGAEIIARAFQDVIASGLVVENECFWLIDGWSRRQPKVPRKSTERVRKYRKTLKKTEKKRNENETQVKHNETRFIKFHHVSETHETHNEKEKEREKEKKREKRKNLDANASFPEKQKSTEKPEKPAKEEPTGRFKSLQRALEGLYSDFRGVPYGWQGGKDGSALKSLLTRFTDELILQAWERGLTESNRYLNISTVAELSAKVNNLLAPPVAGVKNNPPASALTQTGQPETPEQHRRRMAVLKRRLTSQGEPALEELRAKWLAKNDALLAAGKQDECDIDYLLKKGIEP